MIKVLNLYSGIGGNRKWSRYYDKCENCNTNESKHKGYGLCVKCWEKLKRNKTLKRKDWQKRFREKNIERIMINIITMQDNKLLICLVESVLDVGLAILEHCKLTILMVVVTGN